MADHFANRFWATKYWNGRYFQAGINDPGAIYASISGAGAIVADLTATSQPDVQPTGGGYAWKGPAEPHYRVHPEYEDKPKKKRTRKKVGEQVILTGEPEIQTGIIEVTPALDALGEIQRSKDEAERIRRAKLRAIALADDEWLMVA